MTENILMAVAAEHNLTVGDRQVKLVALCMVVMGVNQVKVMVVVVAVAIGVAVEELIANLTPWLVVVEVLDI
jgi:hypothetical protein